MIKSRPLLFVDLDGTLVRTDTLWEQIATLLRQPYTLPGMILALFHGKLAFKNYCLKYAGLLDYALLPYNQDVLSFISEAKKSGSKIILCTASLKPIALGVASYLDCFDDVMASDETVNLSGHQKKHAVELYANSQPFDYIGNSHKDIPVWIAAGRAIIINPEAKLISRVKNLCSSMYVLPDSSKSGSILLAYKQLRIYQWIKNALVFIPFMLAHNLTIINFQQALLAFLCFSLSASSVYIFNDLMDLDADRIHPRKRFRPLASGLFSIPISITISSLLLLCAYCISILFLSSEFTLILTMYLVLTTLYSMYLKKIVIVDVIVLAGLYTSRIIAGGFATNVPLSPWLLGFSMFVFLSLAFVKRYTEVLLHVDSDEIVISGRGYTSSDGSILLSAGISSAMISILVLALYMNSDDVMRLYHHPLLLWLLCPVFLTWLLRVWFIAHRGNMHDDPIIFMAKDSFSYIIFSLILAVVIVAAL